MASQVETRWVLRCDWCEWEVYSKTAQSAEELRAKAAEQDGWRVVDGEDVCGQLHDREKVT